jgi:hypothetical protein
VRVQIVEVYRYDEADNDDGDTQPSVVVDQKYLRVDPEYEEGRNHVAGVDENEFRNQKCDDTGRNEDPKEPNHPDCS